MYVLFTRLSRFLGLCRLPKHTVHGCDDLLFRLCLCNMLYMFYFCTKFPTISCYNISHHSPNGNRPFNWSISTLFLFHLISARFRCSRSRVLHRSHAYFELLIVVMIDALFKCFFVTPTSNVFYTFHFINIAN